MKCLTTEEEGKGKKLLGHAPNGSKIERLLKEMKKVKENEGRGPWDQASSQALDRALGGLERILTHQVQFSFSVHLIYVPMPLLDHKHINT